MSRIRLSEGQLRRVIKESVKNILLNEIKITDDTDLRNFQFWSGAKDNADSLTSEQLDEVQSILEDCYPDGLSATQLNDIFWFDFDWIKEQLGISDDEEEGYDDEY